MIELTENGKEYYRNLLAQKYFELSVTEQNRRDILFDITYERVNEAVLFQKGRDSSLGRLFSKTGPKVVDLYRHEYNLMIKEGYIVNESGNREPFKPSKDRQR